MTHARRVLPEVLPLRHASRELVRELGFLQARDLATGLSHSHCHAMIEIESRGSVNQSELPAALRLDKSTTSRIVAELESRGWVRARTSADDRRARVLALTRAGGAKVALVHREANSRVEDALRLLGDVDRAAALRGMQVYARALERARRRASYRIRPVAPKDRAGCARLIRTVLGEFGGTGPGFAFHDPEVDDMYGAYRGKKAGYFVIASDAADDGVVGAAGFGALAGGDGRTCELRKMYFYPELRGLGLGQDLLDHVLAAARKAGYGRMYLETLVRMTQARALYERNGFTQVKRCGTTGHFTCDVFYVRDL